MYQLAKFDLWRLWCSSILQTLFENCCNDIVYVITVILLNFQNYLSCSIAVFRNLYVQYFIFCFPDLFPAWILPLPLVTKLVTGIGKISPQSEGDPTCPSEFPHGVNFHIENHHQYS